ncbi:MAG: hypothetical protein J0I57_13985 [Hyphomicrobium sp.]|nr:hypothetical protein [Hyphomicrobium sp.]MBN9278718.1 hypothetical protein [Hyphomicrobium sp.]OJU26535.1 MAG: hypothetical protein BGN89_07085 [Alphaproteobacteria bacterium 64-6]
MQLGTLMDHLAFEEDAAAALEALGDIVLFSNVQTMGERFEETPGEYVANAARRFAALGSDEEWLGLMAAMERSDDPARAALDRMLRWALKVDAADTPSTPHPGCTCGGGACHDQLG